MDISSEPSAITTGQWPGRWCDGIAQIGGIPGSAAASATGATAATPRPAYQRGDTPQQIQPGRSAVLRYPVCRVLFRGRRHRICDAMFHRRQVRTDPRNAAIPDDCVRAANEFQPGKAGIARHSKWSMISCLMAHKAWYSATSLKT